jgi:hypothetical protein
MNAPPGVSYWYCLAQRCPLRRCQRVDKNQVHSAVIQKSHINFHIHPGKCISNCQSMSEVALENLQRILQDRGRAEYFRNLHTSPPN